MPSSFLHIFLCFFSHFPCAFSHFLSSFLSIFSIFLSTFLFFLSSFQTWRRSRCSIRLCCFSSLCNVFAVRPLKLVEAIVLEGRERCFLIKYFYCPFLTYFWIFLSIIAYEYSASFYRFEQTYNEWANFSFSPGDIGWTTWTGTFWGGKFGYIIFWLGTCVVASEYGGGCSCWKICLEKLFKF